MQDVTVCKECGVPETFYQAHLWLNNGDIVQSVNQRVRLGFIECEMLDPLFNNVGDIMTYVLLWCRSRKRSNKY